MQFTAFSAIAADDWNRVVLESDDGWALSTYEWLEMVTDVWSQRSPMDNIGFAIEENDRLVAVMPLHWIPELKLISSSGWGAGGPVVLNGFSENKREKLWKNCVDEAQRIAVQKEAAVIKIMICASTRSSLNNQWGINPLIKHGFADTSTQSLVINLEPEEDVLWQALGKNTRRTIERVSAAGYSAKRTPWSQMIDAYFDAHVETYERTGVTPHPKSYFSGIAKMPEEYFPLWVGFTPQGEAAAFHGDISFGGSEFYFVGCSQSEHIETGINSLLFWEAIRGAKQRGNDWYESGEVFPDAVSGKEHGLTVFKSKFGGQNHRYFKGEKVMVVPDHEPFEPVIAPISPLREWLRATRSLGRAIAEHIYGLLRRNS